MKTYANITNGLWFPHDDVCHFMSTHAHRFDMGYLRLDSMPYSAVIELLHGRPIRIVDATHRNKPLTDAIRFGLTTWVMIFNRAIRDEPEHQEVAPWATWHMWVAAHRGRTAGKIVQRIRRLNKIYGNRGAAMIGENELVRVTCYRNFAWDDRPLVMGAMMHLRDYMSRIVER